MGQPQALDFLDEAIVTSVASPSSTTSSTRPNDCVVGHDRQRLVSMTSHGSSNSVDCGDDDGDDSSLARVPLLLRIILSKEDDEDNDGIANDDNNCYSKATDNKINAKNAAATNLRHLSLTTAVQSLTTYELLHQIQILDDFRRTCPNLYQRVRALFFLYAVHRFLLSEWWGWV